MKLHIVGIPYSKDIEGSVSEFLADAPGRAMTIRAQHDNVVDSNAIRAYDWQGRHVGYVSTEDLPTAWGALRTSGRKSLRGRIISTNVEHPCAIFECTISDTFEPEYDLFSQKRFLDWQYSGPVLEMPENLSDLEYMVDEIDDRLAEVSEWTDEERDDFVNLAGHFIEKSVYDISGDMEDYRRRMRTRLLQSDIEELENVADDMNLLAGRIGREAKNGVVLKFWMEQLQSKVMGRKLLVYRKRYNQEKIEEELRQFPDDMYYEWLGNRDVFVSKVYYKHIPREVLWCFVSGIAFVEAMKATLKKEEEETQQKIKENIQRAAKAAVQIDVNAGALAQITDKGISNQYQPLPKR